MSGALEVINRFRIFKFLSRGKSVNSNRGCGINRTSECFVAVTKALHFQQLHHCNALATVHTSDRDCAVFGLEATLLPCVFLHAHNNARLYLHNALKVLPNLSQGTHTFRLSILKLTSYFTVHH